MNKTQIELLREVNSHYSQLEVNQLLADRIIELDNECKKLRKRIREK